jgi:Protein of unknown function (DUF3047)
MRYSTPAMLWPALWLLFLANAHAQAPMEAAAFSRATTPGGLPPDWQPFSPAPKAKPTLYTLVRDTDRMVVRADARQSMSGLIRVVRVDLNQTPLLQWQWRITRVVASADMNTKAGDDYAARLYVLFDYDSSKLPVGTRLKIKLAKLLYSVDVPAAALNYVWDNRHPIGTLQANAYTDRVRMLVVESGAAHANEWRSETRDVAADFRAAFGEEAPAVVSIAIASDTDNTGEDVTAWFGDIRFLPR